MAKMKQVQIYNTDLSQLWINVVWPFFTSLEVNLMPPFSQMKSNCIVLMIFFVLLLNSFENVATDLLFFVVGWSWQNRNVMSQWFQRVLKQCRPVSVSLNSYLQLV